MPDPLPDDANSVGATPTSRQEEIEIQLVRSLLRLTEGNPSEFADLAPHPRSITKWLHRADIRQVRGLLIATLRRWHQWRDRQPKDP